MRSARVWGALLLLALGRDALAQEEPRKTPALEAATERFESGKRLFREGKKEHNPAKLEKAYFEFKAAYVIYPGRGALLNLIETEIATNRPLDAMLHVREYDRSYGEPDPASEYRHAYDTQREAAFRATGHIKVVGPNGMRVVVDGQEDGLTTPLREPIDVTAGAHVVELVGADTLRGQADAGAGAITQLTFAQAQALPSPPAIATSPDDAAMPAPAADAPKPLAEVAPVRPVSFWTPVKVAGASAGVAGVFLIGVGALFAVRANQDADSAASLGSMLGPSGCAVAQSAACRDLQSTHDDQSRDHALNLVFVSVGAAAVVSGAVLLLWPSPSRHGMAVAPSISAQGGGLQLRGEI